MIKKTFMKNSAKKFFLGPFFRPFNHKNSINELKR